MIGQTAPLLRFRVGIARVPLEKDWETNIGPSNDGPMYIDLLYSTF
jgi:hypothetical protein